MIRYDNFYTALKTVKYNNFKQWGMAILTVYCFKSAEAIPNAQERDKQDIVFLL